MIQKLDCSRIKVGVVFSEPVYFDDGQNMFLAKNSPAKAYHVAALKRWKIPFLLTAGYEVKQENQNKNEKIYSKTENSVSNDFGDEGLLEELEEI